MKIYDVEGSSLLTAGFSAQSHMRSNLEEGEGSGRAVHCVWAVNLLIRGNVRPVLTAVIRCMRLKAQPPPNQCP